MKTRIIIVVLVSMILTTACAFPTFTSGRNLRGSGNVVTETHPVSDFQQLSIDGVGELYLVQGEQESLEIEAEDNILKRMEIRVVNGKLTIGYEKGFFGWNVIPTEPIRFYLTAVQLDEITINGGVKIINKGWQGSDLALVINGAADISMENISLNTLDLNLEGGSNCRISGETEGLDIQVDGAGSINLDDLKSANARVTVNGLSDVRVWTTQSLVVEINGAGQVSYYGDPEVDSEINGIGNVHDLGEK